MWSKLKELVNSKKTILMVLTIVAAVAGALTDACTGREAFEVICAALGLNIAAIGLQDFGRSAKIKEVELVYPPRDVVKEKVVEVKEEEKKPE